MKRPYLTTPNEYLTQSSLLLQAYPTTTRITTKYSIKPPPTAEQLSKKRKRSHPKTHDTTGTANTAVAKNTTAEINNSLPAPANDASTSQSSQHAQPPTQPSAEEAVKTMTPRAYLTLKTYEPHSGICIKYRTDKEREVGRLMASLGRLGRQMAALPVEEGAEGAGEIERAVAGAEVMEVDGADGAVKGEGVGGEAPAIRGGGQAQGAGGGAGGGGGGGKKKKKGKK